MSIVVRFAPIAMDVLITLVRTPIGVVDIHLGNINVPAGRAQAAANVVLPANLRTGVSTVGATTAGGLTVTTNVTAS